MPSLEQFYREHYLQLIALHQAGRFSVLLQACTTATATASTAIASKPSTVKANTAKALAATLRVSVTAAPSLVLYSQPVSTPLSIMASKPVAKVVGKSVGESVCRSASIFTSHFFRKAKGIFCALACCLFLVQLLQSVHAQQSATFSSTVLASTMVSGTTLISKVAPHEFSFARLVYEGAGWSDWPRWQADWPEAETHFLAGLNRLTRLDSAREGVLVNLESDEIFDYPWMYAVEVGSLELSQREAARLREYLLRGGFLMVDDFHGISQWQQFQATLKKVFPKRPIEELDSTQLFSVLFDVGESLQIPGIRPLMANRTWEYGGTVPRWRVLRDDKQRVMVAINFNMDLGDAWEHADDARYPQRYSALAYRIGTNYVLYALTH